MQLSVMSPFCELDVEVPQGGASFRNFLSYRHMSTQIRPLLPFRACALRVGALGLPFPRAVLNSLTFPPLLALGLGPAIVRPSRIFNP